MEFVFDVKFKTDLNPKDPNNANAIRFIEEYGMEKYLQNLQAYILVSIEQEMQMLFANEMRDFEVKVSSEDITLYNKDRNDIMRSAF